MPAEDRRARPPLPRWLGALGEPVYRWAITRRNRRFDASRDIIRFQVPVISVGNLSVGGTGKSPAVAFVVGSLLEMGKRPAIVMRGYKRRPGEASDEQAEYIARFADSVPVEADPDRSAAIRRVLESGRCDAVVLDDGFQRRCVGRDLDIVLIDATRDIFADRLLPAGWLREPASSLSRAGVIVMTRSDHAPKAERDRMWALAAAVAPSAASVESVHAWTGVRVSMRAESRAEPIDWLRGRKVALTCGIGNPTAFRHQAEKSGCRVVHAEYLPDHHHWTREEAAALARAATAASADCVLTTMKDWVKLDRFAKSTGIAWAVPTLELRIIKGGAALSKALALACAARGA